MDGTEMSDSLGEGSGKKLNSSCHPTKKQRTVDLFPRPRSDPSHCNSNSNSNRRHPTPLASCNRTTTTTTTTANFSLETRSRLSSFSDSFSSGSFSALPAYVVDIPPIPNLDADSNADRGKKTSTPSSRSLLAIRRYISPSLN